MKAFFPSAMNRFCLLALLIAGCSQSPQDMPETAPVTGIILLDGKPLPYATIVFQPKEGRPSNGQSDAEGKYELQFNQDTMGAKLGPHQVLITTYREFDHQTDPNQKASPELLPAKYHSKSELTATVKEGDNQIPFDLDSK